MADEHVPTGPDALFERHRPLLRAMAHRLLGTFPEAEEAVEDARRAWHRPDDPTTALARECLTRLRAREAHRARPWDPRAAAHGAQESPPQRPPALLDRLTPGLTPPERLAFVLHDEFEVPYERIAPALGHTPVAARRLAARARHRLQAAEEMPERDVA
ncbi:sigma factor-like helix-turn-helix DNA-binding protein [Streptomyces sp. NPDC058326]|uniref:sigma factor-like helix-turn-helix DNA-binding protein n=1 Tax=Streptomyces sp. NPDC058326 TaxID=3346447 RepID=UPI0036F11E2F